MKKLIFLFLIINSSLFAQHTNVFRDSTVFTKALTLVPGASAGKVLTSDATGNATWQTSVGGWSLTGNTGTDPATNFVGTTDSAGLILRSGLQTTAFDSYMQLQTGTYSSNGYAALSISDSAFNSSSSFGFDNSGMAFTKGNFLTDTAVSFNLYNDSVVFLFNSNANVPLTIYPTGIKYVDGTQGAGKVLTSDADGLASWQTLTGLDTNAVSIDSLPYLPISGGTMDSGSHIYFGTGGQNISQGTFDNSTGGNKGISLNCAVGYELNWQGGHLSSSYNNGTTFYPVIVDTALLINGTIQITDGTQGSGKVLTSNAYGLASWQTLALTDTATLNFGSISANGHEVLTITVTGAALSDVVSLGIPNVSMNDHASFVTWVSSANTVSVKCFNFDGSNFNPAAGLFTVKVFK